MDAALGSHEGFEVAQAVQAAVTSMDVGTVSRLYAEGVVLWHNFDDRTQTGPENLEFLRGLFAQLESLVYRNVRRTATGSGYVQQHLLEGLCRNGRRFAIHACHVVRVEGGRIAVFDEYFDPAPLFAALEA